MKRSIRLALLSVVALLVVPLALPAWGATATARDINDACGDAQDAGFKDVPDGNPHNPTIDCIKHYGITSGKTADTYDPGGSLRRDQLATFLAATLEAGGETLPEPTQDYFTDDNGNPHESNINKLAEAGIIDGSADKFGVAAIPTRAEMSEHTAAAMSYAEVLPTGSVPDYFSDDSGMAAEDSINRLAHAGVVTGKTTSTFAPNETLRRDQMATFLARSIDLIQDNGSLPGDGGSGGGTGTATSCGSGTLSSTVSISTIRADGPGNDVEVYNDSEYVRLANSGSADVNLSGWVLEDAVGNYIKVGDGFTIKANSTFTVYSGDGDNVSTSKYFANRSQAMWNNSGDTATLCDSHGKTADEYSY